MNKVQITLLHKKIYLVEFLLFTTLSYLALRNGISLSYDSCIYLEGANQVKESWNVLILLEGKYSLWGPLNFLVLGFIGTSELMIILFQYSCIMISIFMWTSFTFQLNLKVFEKYIFALLISSSMAFILCEKFLWSESFFILLISCYVFFNQCFERDKKNVFFLLLLTIIGILIPMQRFAGLFFLVPFWFYEISENHLNERKSIDKKYLVHITIIVFLFFSWFFQSLGGISIREESSFDLSFIFRVLSDFNLVIERYFIPFSSYGIITFLFFSTLIQNVFFSQYKMLKKLSFTYIIYSIFYITVIVMKKAGSGYQELDRFLAPLFPIFCLVFVTTINKITSIRLFTAKPLLYKIIVFIWICYPLGRALKNSWLYGKLPEKTGVDIPCDYLNK